jgi:hypothetical protein
MALAGAACAKNQNPDIDLGQAVINASTSATELTVKSYREGGQATVLKGSTEYETVITYMAKYTPDRTQPRYHEIAGKTEEVTIPYTLDYMLTFKMNNGPNLVFDFSYDKIWFTTKDTLYAGLVDINMDSVLQQIVNK